MFVKPNKNCVMQKVGFLGISGQMKEVFGSIVNSPSYEISGVYMPDMIDNLNIKDFEQVPFFKNPFGLIADSDLLIINKTDENSYNLIIECIQNSRNILISHPENLTLEEIDYLNKLAIEASINICPLVSYKYKNFISDSNLIPRNPRLLRIKSKGRYNLINILTASQLSLFFSDLVTSLINVPLKKIGCHSVKITDGFYPLTNMTIQFESGSVAHMEIDTISDKESLVLEVYYLNQIIEIDLLSDKMKRTTLENNNNRNSAIIENISNNINLSFQQMIDYVSRKEDKDFYQNHLINFKATLSIYNKLKEKLVS